MAFDFRKIKDDPMVMAVLYAAAQSVGVTGFQLDGFYIESALAANVVGDRQIRPPLDRMARISQLYFPALGKPETFWETQLPPYYLDFDLLGEWFTLINTAREADGCFICDDDEHLREFLAHQEEIQKSPNFLENNPGFKPQKARVMTQEEHAKFIGDWKRPPATQDFSR